MNRDLGFSVSAGQDLSTSQYKAIAVGGTIAATSKAAMGILQNKPENGEDASLDMIGPSRYKAGAAVTAGANLAVTTSGWFITAASGDSGVGKAFATVTSGSIGEGMFNFATQANPL